MFWISAAIALAFILLALLLRLLYVLFKIWTTEPGLISTKPTLRIILCIGSGGHTTEILRLMKLMDRKKYEPRLYIIADNDLSSEVKVHTFEESYGNSKYSVSRIPRSRNVNQSYSSSIISTLYATANTIPVIFQFKPDIIFCNGPGTCIPVCVVAFLLKCFFILDCKIVFVESICRVTTLSLTGKILQYFADILIVQWPQLRDECFRAKYFGRLT